MRSRRSGLVGVLGPARALTLGIAVLAIVTGDSALRAQDATRSRLWVHGSDVTAAGRAMVFLSAVSPGSSADQEPFLTYMPGVLSPTNVNVFVDDTNVGPVTIEGFDDSAVGLDVVLAIDVSGSVASHYEVVRRGVSAFVDRRREAKDQIALVLFGSEVKVSQFKTATGLTPFSADTAALKTFIKDAPSGEMRRSTLFYRGAAQAIHTAARGRTGAAMASVQKVLFLFTDGHDEGTGFTIDEAIAAGRAGSIQVFGLALPGGRDGDSHHSNLQQLARQTGGAFVTINGLPRLAQVFERLDYLIKNENIVSFAFPAALADGNEHVLRIEAKHLGEALSTSIRLRAPSGLKRELPPPPEPWLRLRDVVAITFGVFVMGAGALGVRTAVRFRQFERARQQNAESLQKQV